MIYLVRHGQTNSNINHVWQGQSGNDGLSETGSEQAEKLGEYLVNKNITKIISSPQRRAKETALRVSESLSIEIEYDDLLKEMSYGDFEGMSNDQIIEKYHDLYAKWKSNPNGVQFPNGESFDQLVKRGKDTVEKYMHTKENILLVSHEDCIRGIIVAVSGKPSEFWLPTIKNTSITTFIEDEASIKLLDIGQTPHLRV